MKKNTFVVIGLIVVGIACLSSAFVLRMTSRTPREQPSDRLLVRFPNYAGFYSTDVCAGNPFQGRNNNLLTAPTCPGFPGSGCYACDPPTNTQPSISGMQTGAGAGSCQPAGGNGNCNVYELFQGQCVSNGGNYICNPLVDQVMTCSGTYPLYDLQIQTNPVVQRDADPGRSDRSWDVSGENIVIR